MSASSKTPPGLSRLSGDDCRRLVESAADYAIFMLDVDGRVVTWNVGAAKIKGYDASEIIGEHVSRFFTPEDIAAGAPERQLRLATELGRAEDEGWRVRKDGSRFWASAITTALRDEQGKLRGFGKVTRDLTARKRAEDQLRASEERFHHLVDAVTDYAIVLLDPTGHVATWNEGARRLKGYEQGEIIGQHFSRFYAAEDRAAGRPERLLDTVRREGRVEDESWRVRKDGSRFWADVIITALRDERGEVTGFAKVTRDLSHRRAVEEELRRSEQRFRLLVDGVTDYAIYMLDPEGLVTTWNIGAQRMKGYSSAEILGRNFSAFFPDEDVRAGTPRGELAQAREHGHFAGEGWRIRKDGSRFWASVVVTSLRGEHDELVGFAKVTRDMTAQRQAEATERRLLREQAARAAAEENEARLRASEEAARVAAASAEAAARRAEEANRVKDDFLATASHELRTPLNAILGWSRILRDRTDDPSIVKGLDVIRRNAEAQTRLVEDLLDVSRIMAGKLRLDVRAFDLVPLVREAIDVARPSAIARGVAITLAPRDELVVTGDPARLRQVVDNLLSNAVKFTSAGGRITVDLTSDGDRASLVVEDTGCGIEPAALARVFDRFAQEDSTTTRAQGGLGLGLTIVRHVVELHGGEVRAESGGRGAGARFTVTLPVRARVSQSLEELADDDEGAPVSFAKPDPALLRGVRVLVVDDDDDTREMLQHVLTASGAEVAIAASAASGFDAVRSFRPHVLVSDIGMPGEDGYAFVRRVRAIAPTDGGRIPTIALTAYTREQDRTKALDAGFTTHVGKPVDPQDLVAAVANIAPVSRA